MSENYGGWTTTDIRKELRHVATWKFNAPPSGLLPEAACRLETLEAIVRDLAGANPVVTNVQDTSWQECGDCHEGAWSPNEITHLASCPWRRAVEWVRDSATQETDG